MFCTISVDSSVSRPSESHPPSKIGTSGLHRGEQKTHNKLDLLNLYNNFISFFFVLFLFSLFRFHSKMQKCKGLVLKSFMRRVVIIEAHDVHRNPPPKKKMSFNINISSPPSVVWALCVLYFTIITVMYCKCFFS